MERLPLALLPLRLFLGGTFVYAGIQKLTDPGFLHPGAPTYIGTQLHGFANGTPGGFLLRAFAIPIPEVAGVAVALTEILVGLLVLVGLYTRGAAVVGLSLNLLLFLTASWHTSPYFLGPDLVFAFAWSAIAIGGAEGQPSLDQLFATRLRGRERVRSRGGLGDEPVLGGVSTRRALLLEAAGLALAIGGISALLKGSYTAPRALAATKRKGGHPSSSSGGGSEKSPPNGGSSSESGGGGTSGGGGASGGGAGPPANGVKLGPASALPAGQGATYPDPESGEPDIIIRAEDGSLTAFSAVCTHAGCTVGYEGGVIICPCHGGEYDPTSGAVIAGPPPAPLTPKKVVEAGGDIYAVPS